jgi:peptidoglycan/xylan/chitin deacetylase (PgdA/CDA1 family)
VLALAAAALGCTHDIADIDGVFYDGDGRLVHCALGLDSSRNRGAANLDAALDRARDRGEVVELYAHNPGVTVPVAAIEYVLAGARDRGLAFVTYADFARGQTGPGLALSFDDHTVAAWVDQLPLFAQYAARITFFVSRYPLMNDDDQAGLRQLAAAGHDVEPHTVHHYRAPQYVEEYGLDTYLHDDLDPSIEALRADGFEPHAFAYPFGARTGELDAAIARRVPVLRSVAFSSELAEDPCPR